MNAEVLQIFDYGVIRLLLLVHIAYVTHYNPVVGILLAMCYVVTIQHLNSTKVNGLPVEGNWTNDESSNHDTLYEQSPSVAETMGEEPAQVSENFDDYPVCDSFTTSKELVNAQSNKLSGQDAQVQTWEQQLGPQGIGSDPIGQNMNDVGGPSPF